ncbi:MAG: hypothetical protein IJN66_01450 [Muribaculaceae bacterium]|nr:hypothetical protein [Muribaculaceae bacterium]
MNSSISLNLSTTAIITEIYAASALRCLQNIDNGRRPPLLTRDQEPALRLLVKDSFAHIVLRLLPHIAECNLNEDNEGDDNKDIILSVDINVPACFPSSATITLRHAIEHAIAMDALHLCYMGHNDNLSRRHASLAEDAIRNITQLLSVSDHSRAKIAMNWL